MTKAEYTKLWREKNKDKFKLQEKEYYLSNKESILKTKAEYESKRKQTDLNYKLKKTIRARLSNAIKNGQKSGSAIKDLGCSIEELRKHIESQFKDEMSWDNWGSGPNKWQIDHIKPLFKFDLTNEDSLKEVCNYKNLQPMWYQDHLAKTKQDLNED